MSSTAIHSPNHCIAAFVIPVAPVWFATRTIFHWSRPTGHATTFTLAYARRMMRLEYALIALEP
jgi:hypothetical protein